MPDTQISEEMVDIAARAVYAVSVRAIEPALGIPMCKFEELPERDLNLHRDYAKAALKAALSGYAVVPVADLVELTRICNSGEHDAGYTARKLIGHPMQLNVGVLRETSKLIREKIKGHLPAQMEPNPTAGAS